MKLTQRFAIVLVFVVYFVVSYKGIQWITFHYLNPVELLLPGENKIPFWPAFFIIYSSVYILPAFIFFLPYKKGHLYKMFVVFFLASLIHYFIFLTFPVYYSLRPAVSASLANPFMMMIQIFYQLDDPLNCFPSIHVSFAFISYYFVKRYRPEHARATFILAVAIAVSTLVVKQHYILDVISAILLAIVINRFVITRRFAKPVFSESEGEF